MRSYTCSYTDIQLKTFIHGMEVFNMKIIMRRDSVILSKSRNRLRQRRNLSDERIESENRPQLPYVLRLVRRKRIRNSIQAMRGGYSPPLMIFRYLADKKSHGTHKYRQYCPSALRLILQVIFDSISYFRTTNRDTTDKSIFPPKISLVGL